MVAILNYIIENYVLVLLLVTAVVILSGNRKVNDGQIKYIWVAVWCSIFIAIIDSLEVWTAMDRVLLYPRTILVAAGYCLRPVTALALLFVIETKANRRTILWIPEVLNVLIYITAFYSPIAFSFNENYQLVKGPLGLFSFALSFVYVGLIIYHSILRFKMGRRGEALVLSVCALGCIAGNALDAKFGGTRLVASVLMSSVFYFMYVRAQNSDHDALTGVMNRQCFYDDCKNNEESIDAVATIDMNGLKELNDRKGHAAGDEALVAIGKSLLDVTVADRRILAYRVGGDEFMLLFRNCSEEEVQATLQKVQDGVTRAGVVLAYGYGYRNQGQRIETMLRQSDERMYKNKAEYYKNSGRDRRSR